MAVPPTVVDKDENGNDVAGGLGVPQWLLADQTVEGMPVMWKSKDFNSGYLVNDELEDHALVESQPEPDRPPPVKRVQKAPQQKK